MVFDTGEQWSIVSGEPIRELDKFCAASCIDVPADHVVVGGYSDLRRAPLVSKLRNVRSLRIVVDSLPDLRGLENVNVEEAFELDNFDDSSTTFASLEGLTDREMLLFSVRRTWGLESFDATRFDALEEFSTEGSGFRSLDMSSLRLKHLSLVGDVKLTDLRLSSERLESLQLMRTSELTQLTWPADLVIGSFVVLNNEKLSTCLVQELVSATRANPRSPTLLGNNGPCP